MFSSDIGQCHPARAPCTSSFSRGAASTSTSTSTSTCMSRNFRVLFGCRTTSNIPGSLAAGLPLSRKALHHPHHEHHQKSRIRQDGSTVPRKGEPRYGAFCTQIRDHIHEGWQPTADPPLTHSLTIRLTTMIIIQKSLVLDKVIECRFILAKEKWDVLLF